MKTIKIYLSSTTTQISKATGQPIIRPVAIPSKKNQQQAMVSKSTGMAFLKHSDQYIRWKKLTAPFWEAQAWKAAQMGIRLPVVRCKTSIIFYFHDDKDRDCTNKAESIMDALVECGILADDNFKVAGDLSLKGFLCRNKPRCEIYITILEPEDPGYDYDVTDYDEVAKMKKEKAAERRRFAKKPKK